MSPNLKAQETPSNDLPFRYFAHTTTRNFGPITNIFIGHIWDSSRNDPVPDIAIFHNGLMQVFRSSRVISQHLHHERGIGAVGTLMTGFEYSLVGIIDKETHVLRPPSLSHNSKKLYVLTECFGTDFSEQTLMELSVTTDLHKAILKTRASGQMVEHNNWETNRSPGHTYLGLPPTRPSTTEMVCRKLFSL